MILEATIIKDWRISGACRRKFVMCAAAIVPAASSNAPMELQSVIVSCGRSNFLLSVGKDITEKTPRITQIPRIFYF
jgi:hypothetical protein